MLNGIERDDDMYMCTTLEIKQFCRWWVTLKTEVCINEGVTHIYHLTVIYFNIHFTAVLFFTVQELQLVKSVRRGKEEGAAFSRYKDKED